MSKQLKVDFEGGKFYIYCPIWANDALNDFESKRWSKTRRAWQITPLRKSIEAIEALRPTADVTPAAEAAISDFDAKMKSLKSRSVGFPVWYPFKTKPRAHQIPALNKAYGLPAFALFMDRGTGKSKTVIDLACALRMEDKIQAILVIVRASLRLNWKGWDIGDGPGQKEGFEGHAPIPFSIHIPKGGDAAAMKKYKQWMSDKHEMPVLIMSTESFSQGSAVEMAHTFLGSFTKVMTVIDEGHDIGNADSIRSKRIHELKNLSDYRIMLTGTPIMTGPMNLYSEFQFLDPNIIGIGDFYAFRNRYAVMGGFPNPKTGKPTEIIGYQNLDELAELVAPYIYECRKEDVLSHLPPKVYERVMLKLTPEQKKVYQTIKREKYYEFKGEESEIENSLELALRLHQVCGGYISKTSKEVVQHGDRERVKKTTDYECLIPPDRNPKMIELKEWTDQGKQMIIWAAYLPEIKAIVEQLKKWYPKEEVAEMHGAISEEDREIYKKKFQSGKIRIMVGNQQTGGTGHTLTAAEIMIYWNNTRKMVDREQSEDRAHRDGLQHSVLYVDFIVENTVDVMFMNSIEEKKDLAEYMRENIRRINDLMGEG